MSEATRLYAYARTIDCPWCPARVGEDCLRYSHGSLAYRGRAGRPHHLRVERAREREEGEK